MCDVEVDLTTTLSVSWSIGLDAKLVYLVSNFRPLGRLGGLSEEEEGSSQDEQ